MLPFRRSQSMHAIEMSHCLDGGKGSVHFRVSQWQDKTLQWWWTEQETCFVSKGRLLLCDIQPSWERGGGNPEGNNKQKQEVSNVSFNESMQKFTFFSIRRRKMSGLISVLGWRGNNKDKAIHCLILCSCYSQLADIYRKARLGWILGNNFWLLG